MSLNSYLNYDTPVGPDDAAQIPSLEDAANLLDPAQSLRQSLRHHYTLIYGRKGSGKSSIFSAFQSYQHLKDRILFTTYLRKNPKRADLVAILKNWREFAALSTDAYAAAVNTLRQPVPASAIPHMPVEAFEHGWAEIIWKYLIDDIYGRCTRGELDREDFPHAHSVVEGRPLIPLSHLSSDFDDIAKRTFEAAKNEIKLFLKKENINYYALFDTIEEYPIKQEGFEQVLGGFAKCARTFSTQHCDKIRISFAFPEELLTFLETASKNWEKDTSLSLRIEWNSRDLFQMIGRRYLLFLKLYFPNAYDKFKHFHLHEKADREVFFSQLLPDLIENDSHTAEQSVPYILRHTQLLPRHLILLFNEICRLNIEAGGSWTKLDARVIRAGIQRTEATIARQILKPYESFDKDLESHLRSAFKDHPPFFSYRMLLNASQKLMPYLSLDDVAIMGLLFDMGVIGRVVQIGNAPSLPKTTYAGSIFSYVHQDEIAFGVEAEYCLHPLFSRLLGANLNRKADYRVAYPQGMPYGIE